MKGENLVGEGRGGPFGWFLIDLYWCSSPGKTPNLAAALVGDVLSDTMNDNNNKKGAQRFLLTLLSLSSYLVRPNTAKWTYSSGGFVLMGDVPQDHTSYGN